MTDNQRISISSDRDALEAIKRGLLAIESSDSVPADFFSSIDFDGWPSLSLKYEGGQYHGSLTTTEMRSFVEFERNLYQAYCLARYDHTDTGRLTKDDRRALELTFQVKKGSTDVDPDFDAWLEALSKLMVDKMSPEYLVVCILGIAFFMVGGAVVRHSLDNRKEIRLKELENKAKEADSEAEQKRLQQLNVMREHDIALFKEAAELAGKNRFLSELSPIASEAHTNLLRSGRHADSFSLGDVKMDQEDTKSLLRNNRRESSEKRHDGAYKVVTVKGETDGFTVDVEHLETGLRFPCSLRDESISLESRSALQEAEWTKSAVNLKIIARYLGARIDSAEILSAELIVEEEDPEPSLS